MSPTILASPPLPVAEPVGRAERLCRLSGAAAALLIFAAGGLAPNPPMHGGTDAAILAHFRTTYVGAMQGAFVWILGLMALLVFAAALAHGVERTRRAGGRTRGLLPTVLTLAALAAVAMLTAAQSGAAATAVVGRHSADVALLRALDEFGHMLAHLSVIPLGLFGLTSALALHGARLGSRWLAASGAVIGVLLAASGSWVFVGAQWLHNVGGLCWLATFLWWIATSVALARAERRPTRAAVPPLGAEPLPAA